MVFVHLNASDGLRDDQRVRKGVRGTSTLVFYGGLADHSHTPQLVGQKLKKQLQHRCPQLMVGDAQDLLIL